MLTKILFVLNNKLYKGELSPFETNWSEKEPYPITPPKTVLLLVWAPPFLSSSFLCALYWMWTSRPASALWPGYW